jgi:hypothetical protein
MEIKNDKYIEPIKGHIEKRNDEIEEWNKQVNLFFTTTAKEVINEWISNAKESGFTCEEILKKEIKINYSSEKIGAIKIVKNNREHNLIAIHADNVNSFILVTLQKRVDLITIWQETKPFKIEDATKENLTLLISDFVYSKQERK